MQVETRECNIGNKNRIVLIFPYNDSIISLVKQIEGRKWSASRKFWHIPFHENFLTELNKQFEGKDE